MSEQLFYGTGRRKSSVARVFVFPGNGKIVVNGKPYRDYLCRDSLATVVTQPLDATETKDAYDIKVNVKGGGLTGQAGAIRLGIARALLNADAEFRPILKDKGFLTRDPRKVERKKPGQPGARKKFQFSKR
ncbi:MAG: 30S ribosomal protein S9 [Candidatus Marinimicrobia bacterium]|nr:30S ribosomal protein S9 [Candidatus Neomarinimicrobiota bacterium]